MSRFLDALFCRNSGPPPVWLMRQAGRYLPSYQALRRKYPLRELFFTPELAAEVTELPLKEFDLDAAILFSDITVTALSLGLSLDFREGPVISPRPTPDTVAHLPQDLEPLLPIQQTISLLVPRLKVPLIGFCGAPFTVATYLLEEKGEGELSATKRWIYHHPEAFQTLLDKLCCVTLRYLQMQEAAGVEAIQIFDSWAHLLTERQFHAYCLPYYRRLIQAVDVPVILFLRGSALRLDELVAVGPRAISFDGSVSLKKLRERVPEAMAIQGNFEPQLLYAPLPAIRREVELALAEMEGDPGWIANLGHGVRPDMSVEAVRCFVEAIKGRWGRRGRDRSRQQREDRREHLAGRSS